jgi:hypothetical protein
MNERNYQVSMMREIYKNADIVCVWLEDVKGTAQRAIQTIKRITSFNAREPGKRTIEYPVLSDNEIENNWNALDDFFKLP